MKLEDIKKNIETSMAKAKKARDYARKQTDLAKEEARGHLASGFMELALLKEPGWELRGGSLDLEQMDYEFVLHVEEDGKSEHRGLIRLWDTDTLSYDKIPLFQGVKVECTCHNDDVGMFSIYCRSIQDVMFLVEKHGLQLDLVSLLEEARATMAQRIADFDEVRKVLGIEVKA